MNIKLEIIRLINEDVITTSCNSVDGLLVYFGSAGANGAYNGYDELTSPLKDYLEFDKQGCVEHIYKFSDELEPGFWHFIVNSEGKLVLTEKCDATNMLEACERHNIHISN